jgi:hypothetical protein
MDGPAGALTPEPVVRIPRLARSRAPRPHSAHRSVAPLALLACGVAAPAGAACAQAPADAVRPYTNTLTVLAGLSQPILFAGANVEAEYLTRRFVLGYSHGVRLDISRTASALAPADRAERLAVRTPWTTGPSAGVRLTNRLQATVDAKAHRADVRHPDGGRARYTVFTLGPALSYTIPVYRGVVVQPMVRWWPTVGTTLDGDAARFARRDGSAFTHRAMDLGFVPNVKVGWRF